MGSATVSALPYEMKNVRVRYDQAIEKGVDEPR